MQSCESCCCGSAVGRCPKPPAAPAVDCQRLVRPIGITPSVRRRNRRAR
ncbi:hypothetical protein STXM2123_5908 [Streptomyces sp. F-3]|nr:hypothetical protein STXM2123_5908 [Streptomyces sp. F-3]